MKAKKTDQIVAEIVAEREKQRAAEQQARDAVTAEFEQRKKAEAAQRKAAQEATERKLKADQEAETRRNVRAANSILSNEDFDRLYPQLRDAWLTKEAAAEAERTKRYFASQW